MARASWVLLSSRLPREPSRLRLAVWRRLRRLGAVLLHDAVWVLPADAATREAFEWLAEEIEEQGVTAFIWEAAGLSPEQDRAVIERFRREADARYAEIGGSARAIRDAALRNRRRGSAPAPALRQLRGLERALRLARRRDHFKAPGRAAATVAVSAASADLEQQSAAFPDPRRARALGD